jgi:hypothetical protein
VLAKKLDGGRAKVSIELRARGPTAFPLCDGDGLEGQVVVPLAPIYKQGSARPNIFDVFGDLLKLDAKGIRDMIVGCLGRGRGIYGALMTVVEIRKGV